ncbi:hypothetical protein ACN38_g13257, partial [Penicillium nordicum]
TKESENSDWSKFSMKTVLGVERARAYNLLDEI